MEQLTYKLWAKQDQHEGDRLRLFTAVADTVQASDVLYPGSFVDIAPSFMFPSVTYLDVDRRAERFFGDADGVREIIAANQADGHDEPAPPTFRFIPADYRDELDLEDQSFDLLISLYAGFISEHCTRYVRTGGHLLVNPSHGDAAMASIDPRYRLVGVVTARSGDYHISGEGLDQYLVPKKPQAITREVLHELGRGIAYTKPAFAYVFERVG